MSEPKLITPLLDNYLMGAPISDSRGIRCCPAILKETEQKYIVKVISIPASQVQLEALLLSGAYPDAEAASKYFKELANDITNEAALLQKLSRLEGFHCYEGWQIEPMEDGTGFDVYLLAEYSLTLERHMRRGGLTHLNAVNLGLDLCAALSVCRRNGHLYVDLKPDNIVISENRGYLIGDIGFISMNSLKYASLPEKYRSAYTAPEIRDAYSSLNTTIDTYAVGMILYQVFNDGKLPVPGEELVPPAYADHEMAQIILKACAADPAERWQDPQEMGQALVSYMQRCTVNDTPIVPVIVPEEEPADADPTEPAAEGMPSMEIPPEEIPEGDAAETVVAVVISGEPEASAEVPEEPVVDAEVEEFSELTEPVDSSVEEKVEILDDSDAVVDSPVDKEPADDDPEQIAIEGFLFTGEELPEELPEGVLTEEVSTMLAQADELIAHKAPDPVVAPEPIEIPIPDPIIPESEPEAGDEDAAAPVPVEETPEEDAPIEDTPAEASTAERDEDEAAPMPILKKPGCLIAELVALVLLVAVVFAGVHFYNNYYLQNITAVTPYGEEDWLTVTLDTEIDNSLLTVICTDTYGNKLTQSVENNAATFTSLPSGATYRITVEIDGFHHLTGITTATYTTAIQTNVVNFTAITGETDGSVILNFSVRGTDSAGWQIEYSAEGEETRTVTCNGHMATVTGLTIGKAYTFQLISTDGLYVVGTDTVELTASEVIYAEELTIHGFNGGVLNADWSISNESDVESWTVRCYNSNGYDTTFSVTEPSVAIEGLDITQAYTLEVKAHGMSVSRRADISANSITFKDILLDNSAPDKLVITWIYEGTVPPGGWQLAYTVDGSEPVIINCEKNTCTLAELVPGATYNISFVFPDSITVFAKEATFVAPDAEMFSGYTVAAENMTVRMCRRPSKEGWIYSDVAKDDYTTDFIAGDNAAFVLRLTKEYVTSPDMIDVLFVIRDSSGAVVDTAVYKSSWTDLWYRGYCELDLPALPGDPGSYTVQIYFNGAYITAEPIAFTVN